MVNGQKDHGFSRNKKGQKNVPFATRIQKKKSNLKTINYCLFAEKEGRPVSLQEMSLYFNKKEGTIKKALYRNGCWKRIGPKLFVHESNKCKFGVGQIKGGVVTRFVPDFVRDIGLPDDLLSFFVSTYKTETHGHEFLSPSGWVVVDPSLVIEESREFEYCNAFFQVRGGRVHVQSRPKFKGHKYGLDSKRFMKYLFWIREQLLDLLGVVPVIDLVRCDINQDRPLNYTGPPIRIEILEGLLALQVYVVERDDWYWELANKRLVRFEVINYGKPALDMAGKIQELLSRKARDISSLDGMNKLLDTLTRVAKHHLQDYGHAVHELRSVVNKQGKSIQVSNELTKATAGLVLSLHEKIDTMKEEVHDLGQIGYNTLEVVTKHDDYFNVLGNALASSIEQNEVQTAILSRIESYLSRVTTLLEEVKRDVQTTITWMDLEREERIALYELIRANNLHIRAVARKLGISHSTIINYYRRHGNNEVVQRGTNEVGQNGYTRDSFNETAIEKILACLQDGAKTKAQLKRITKLAYTVMKETLDTLVQQGRVQKQIEPRYRQGRNPEVYSLRRDEE